MFDVFEQPWTLVGAGVLVLFGMLTFRSVWPEKRRWWQLALPAFIVAAAFGTDRLVQTDREKVHAALKKAMRAVAQQDCNALAELISSDYRDSHHDSKAELVAHSRAELSRSPVEKVKKASLFTEVSPPQAAAILIVWMKFAEDSFAAQTYKPLFLIKVRIHFQKQADKSWLINRAEVLEIDRQPVQWRNIR